MTMDQRASSSDTLLGWLRHHATHTPDAIAYRQITDDAAPGRLMRFGELQRRCDALAAHLAHRLDPGSVVMICSPNTIEFPIAFLGTLAAGCVAFPISTESAPAELSHAAQMSNAQGAIASESFGQPLPLMIRLSQLPDGGAAAPPNRNCAGGVLLLSSGTTEQPKIVRRSIASIDAVSEQIVRSIGFTSDDVVLSMIPLCHSYGLEHGLLAPILSGATVLLAPGFNLPVILRELRDGGITILPGVPSVFEMLAQLAEPGTRLPTLRVAYSAGGALPRAVSDMFATNLGVRVGQLYGATEVGSITFNNPRHDGFDPSSVGIAMNGVDIHIGSLTDPMHPVACGQEGQVWVQAASMFSGYVGEASSPFVKGYFPTSDLGHMNDRGRLTITGRLKLLIDVGGLKVNPMEVEALLTQHPAVADCVVIPVRQSQTLFRLKAVVTPRDPRRPPQVEVLRQFARERLASYKVPRLFEVRPSLPRTVTGKVLRHLVEA